MPIRFARVDKNLLRGGVPSSEDLEMLRDKFGIKKIISLDGPLGNAIDGKCKELNLEHIILPLTDGNGANVDKLPGEVIQWTGPTYVHCRHGKDRTGMACAMYRILVNGWNVEQALDEARKFGMGQGLEQGESYYDAVRHIVGDTNNSDTISQIHRNKIEELQPKPGYEVFNPMSSEFLGGDQGPLGMQQSFAPFLDGTQNHLNMSAALRFRQIKRFAAILNIKNAATYIYRYSRPSEILLMNRLWASSIPGAKRIAEGNLDEAVMHMARIDGQARKAEFTQEPTGTLVQIAMQREADVAVFMLPNGSEQYFIINPDALVDIRRVGGDMNNVPLIGQHDNYTGVANLVQPGSGGFMAPSDGGTMVPGSGGGGFAGFVQLPYMSEL